MTPCCASCWTSACHAIGAEQQEPKLKMFSFRPFCAALWVCLRMRTVRGPPQASKGQLGWGFWWRRSENRTSRGGPPRALLNHPACLQPCVLSETRLATFEDIDLLCVSPTAVRDKLKILMRRKGEVISRSRTRTSARVYVRPSPRQIMTLVVSAELLNFCPGGMQRVGVSQHGNDLSSRRLTVRTGAVSCVQLKSHAIVRRINPVQLILKRFCIFLPLQHQTARPLTG